VPFLLVTVTLAVGGANAWGARAADTPGPIVSGLMYCVASVRRYGRFLMQQAKEDDHEMGQKWLRRAAENLRAKMSPNVTEQEAYHNR